MRTPIIYSLMVRAVTLLVLIGMILPTGLHAKQLVDYCFDRDGYATHTHASVEHHTPDEAREADDHNCCPVENWQTESMAGISHEDCGWGFICTCHIDLASLSDQNWTVPAKVFVGELDPVELLDPNSGSEAVTEPARIAYTYSTPPIFLLNSTFLN